MKARTSDRLAPLAGVVFVLLSIVGFALGSDEPDANASAAKVMAFWTDNDGKEMFISAIFAVATAAVVVFGAALREALRAAEAGFERLASIAFAGVVIAATGILTIVSITFTAADTVGDVSPQVTQTLSALNGDFFFPMAIGFSVMLIASGIVVLRTGLLPRWLGWISIVLGVCGFTPAGIVVFFGVQVWILVVSVLLYLRATKGTAEPAPAGVA